MSIRKTLDQMTSDDLDALHERVATAEQRAEQAEAAIAHVRALHQPVGVVAAAEFGEAPDCPICGPNRWPCPTYDAITEAEPGPAAANNGARTTPNNPKEQP